MITLENGKQALYQWDFGVKANVNVPCNEVHFSEKLYGEALTVLVNQGEVEVPNQLLINAKPFYCWAFINNAESGVTVAQKKFDVKERPKPSNYLYSETEVHKVDSVVQEAVKKVEENLKEYVDNSLHSIYVLQIAPPLSALESAIILCAPTLAQIAKLN